MKKNKKRRSLRMKMIGIQMGVTLASFIVCGVLFVFAVSMLVGRYVNHDVDFLLKEVNSNLEQRFVYLENVAYSIRDSEEMISFLTDEREKVEKGSFSLDTDISGSTNQRGNGGPLVEKTYLFRTDGLFLSQFYYTLVYAEIHESDEQVQKIWHAFQDDSIERNGFEVGIYPFGTKAYMAYPVLDDDMMEIGELIFEVNLNAVDEIMEELDNYNDVQWMIYSGDQIVAGEYQIWGKDCVKNLSGRQAVPEPYIRKMGEMQYRLYTDELCMQLEAAVGIPENQAAVLLYDSLSVYIVGIILILVISLAVFIVITLNLTEPIKEIAIKLRQVRTRGFETKLPDYENREFHEISQAFNQMTEHINTLINQVYQKQISIKEMELKFLQTQMNPHFMFNVLNSIALQAKLEGNEEICELVSTFSKLIQAKIYRSDSEKVSIRQELEYVSYYLKIQKFRYGDKIQWNVKVQNEEMMELKIPKLCIQFLVENAIVHGLEPKPGNGRVDIRVEKKEDSVCIIVADDGVGFETDGEIKLPIQAGKADDRHNHVGINNVDHIIKLMYGETYGLTINSVREKGTQVSIRIPYDGEH